MIRRAAHNTNCCVVGASHGDCCARDRVIHFLVYGPTAMEVSCCGPRCGCSAALAVVPHGLWGLLNSLSVVGKQTLLLLQKGYEFTHPTLTTATLTSSHNIFRVLDALVLPCDAKSPARRPCMRTISPSVASFQCLHLACAWGQMCPRTRLAVSDFAACTMPETGPLWLCSLCWLGGGGGGCGSRCTRVGAEDERCQGGQERGGKGRENCGESIAPSPNSGRPGCTCARTTIGIIERLGYVDMRLQLLDRWQTAATLRHVAVHAAALVGLKASQHFETLNKPHTSFSISNPLQELATNKSHTV